MTRDFRMAGWVKAVSVVATLLLCGAGAVLVSRQSNMAYRLGGATMFLLGVGGLLDVMVSRIVLDDDVLRVISLVRRREYPRAEFESAKVDGGQVVLLRKDGGWLKLPGTGISALSVRNTIHAWIKSAER